MKKSRSVRLALLGGASMALAACGDDAPPKDATFYSDVQACAAVYGEEACQDAKAASEKISDEEAPRFARKEECEAEFGAGNCESRQTTSGGGFFMPLMMGYMVGNMLGNNRFNQPVYRGPNNEAVMPKNGRLFNVGTFSGGASQAAAFRPAAQVTPVKRGGFGGSSSAFRSGGGS
jgi:uncharacterized protein YgiB involved in biofilm formation